MSALTEYIDIDDSQRHNPIQAAITLSQPLDRVDLSKIYKLKEVLTKHKATLFECEKTTADKITAFTGILDRRIDALLTLPAKYPALASKYGYFDYQTALSWRDTSGYPSLAVYGLGSVSFSFSIIVSNFNEWKSSKNPDLPEYFSKLYKDETHGNNDVVRAMYAKTLQGPQPRYANYDNSITIESRFKKLIPPNVRKNIMEAREDFGDNIFILAEAEWETHIAVIPNPDPIVIGFKHGYAWLITTFDLTTLEAEMANQFSMNLIEGPTNITAE